MVCGVSRWAHMLLTCMSISWSSTVFIVADPGNGTPKPQQAVTTSLLVVRGNPPDFLDDQNVPHGSIHEEVINSEVMQTTRTLLVYTPPDFDKVRKGKAYPVLFLYHGGGATMYSLVSKGRGLHM